MKTIIAPVYLHKYLKLKILKEKSSNYLLDYRFIDLNTYLKGFLGEDSDNLLSVDAAFNNAETTIFKDVLEYPTFKKEILDFYRFLLRNGVSTDKLPEDSQTEKELKSLLESLNDLKFREEKYSKLNDLISNENLDDFEIYEGYSTIEERRIYDLLCQRGATKKDFPQQKGSCSVYQCLNMHQEVEAVAQDIIDNDYNIEDINIITADSSYLKPVKQVFDLYRLPFGITEDKVLNNSNTRFILLMELYLDQSVENYRKAVINECFGCGSNPSIDKYLSDFVVEFDECRQEFTYYRNLESTLGKRDLEGLMNLEDKANKIQIPASAKLSDLLAATSVREAMVAAFNIIKDHNDMQELRKLKSTVEKSIQQIDSENIRLFLSTLNRTRTISTSFTNVVAVTTVRKPVPARKKSYVLGCDQSSYPGFRIAEGYFDQNYLDKIGYYSQAEQYNYYLDQIHWIYSSAAQVSFYSSIAGYDGKAKSMAFEIDNISKAEFVNISANDFTTDTEHRLNQDNARKAFIRDNRIYGSISSYEKYFRCPYSYFLNYGLKLYPNEIIDIQANTLGTAAHAIFEKLVQERPKTYGDADFALIDSLINNYFDQLRMVFRKRTAEISSVQFRLAKTLEKAFRFYLSMENATAFEPSYFEEAVFEKLAEKNMTELYVKGIVDRIDTYGNGFRILDYKSSNHTLTENGLLTGKSLQLPTYTKLIKDKTGLEPYGSYYAFYKSPKISVPAYTYSITNKIGFHDQQVLTDMVNDQFKLSGFTYSYDENCDDSTHIRGITAKNKVRGKEILFDQVEEALNSIYEHLITQLTEGNIELTPVDGACTYCNYLSVCNFRGKKIKYPPKLADINLKNKEEDE